MSKLSNLKEFFLKHRNRHWMIVSATLLGILGISNVADPHTNLVHADNNNNYRINSNANSNQQSSAASVARTSAQMNRLNTIATSASNMERDINNNSVLPQNDENMFNSLAADIRNTAMNLNDQIHNSLSASASASEVQGALNNRISFGRSTQTYSVPANYNPGGSVPATQIAMFNRQNVVWHDGNHLMKLDHQAVQRAYVLSTIHSNNEVVYVVGIDGKVGYVYGNVSWDPEPLYMNHQYAYLYVGQRVIDVDTQSLKNAYVIESIHYAHSNLVKYCVNTKYGIGSIYAEIPAGYNPSDVISGRDAVDNNSKASPRTSKRVPKKNSTRKTSRVTRSYNKRNVNGTDRNHGNQNRRANNHNRIVSRNGQNHRVNRRNQDQTRVQNNRIQSSEQRQEAIQSAQKAHFNTVNRQVNNLKSQIDNLIQVVQSDQQRIDSLMRLENY